MAEFRVTYDPDAAAAYFHMSAAPVARTDEVLPNKLIIDFDAAGKLVGIEVLGVREEDLSTFLRTTAAAIEESTEMLGEAAEGLLAIA